MFQSHGSRTRTFVVFCSILYAVVFIAMLVTHAGGEKFYQGFQNFYQILPPFFAGICSIAYARQGKHRSNTRRNGWFLIGLGSLSWALGQSCWTYYETIRGVEVPYPGVADVGYLSSYPFLIVGVTLLFGSMPVAGRARLLLDSAIAASSVGILSWYFLVGKLWESADATTGIVKKLIGVAYPLGDVAILFTALVLLSGSSSSSSLRRSSFFLASGITLFSLADTLFNSYNLTEQGYQTGSWFDWGWSFGWLSIGYASLSALWWPQTNEEIATTVTSQNLPSGVGILRSLTFLGIVSVIAPYFFAATAIGFVAFHDYEQPKNGIYYISNSVFALGLWLIFLVVLRQVFTLIENQFLAVQLRSFNANLEKTVTRRTEQLTALHQLTKAVNDTLVVDQVLEAAIVHTQRALRADAILVVLNPVVEVDINEEGDEIPLITVQRGLENHHEIVDDLTQLPVSSQIQESPIPAKWKVSRAGQEKNGGGSGLLRAPLVWQGQIIGVVSVMRWHSKFGPTDADTLESIGVEVGTAYHNARTYYLALEAADRDSVTGLLNHRAVHQRMEAELGRAGRNQTALSVIMMDLNNFKLFNDTYGHPVGDQVIKRVAHVLKLTCRNFDILARYGGDEFIAVLPDTDEALALVVAERLRECMLREEFQLSGDERKIPVTLSFGIATYPTDATNRHELLAIADSNLYTAKISDGGIKNSSDTQRSSRELRADNSFRVLDTMVTAVDNKDRYTRRHSEDVTEFSLWIAEELGLSEETMRIIQIGGLLHDVGKIGVPEAVLHKPGRLTEEEFEVMKGHPQLGALIVAGIPGMEVVTDIVRSHHERWDGNGYPDSLKGEDIPLLGRLVAVADAFSAMTTSRPYRRGMDWETACEEIRKNIGTQFDPQIAQAFLNAARKRQDALGT